jgi:hypothetical protein
VVHSGRYYQKQKQHHKRRIIMVLTEKLSRPSALAAAALLLLATAIPLFVNRKADAYGLLQDRFIRMSSSAASATNVTYKVSFEVATTQSIQGIVVDFCASSPIIGDACTGPTGFDTEYGSGLSFTNVSNANTFSLNAASSANKVVLTGAGQALNATDVVEFDLVGITNPSTTNQTFYARIITFTTSTGATSYDSSTTGANNPGSEPPVVDAGGIALSTANTITITAKVQERLTFCVYTLGDCGSGGSSIVLGDTNGVLDSSDVFVDKNTQFNVSTNAASGVVIRVKGPTLTSGSNTIDDLPAEAQSTPGTEQFGFCVYQSSGTGLLVSTPYTGDDGTLTGDCSATTQSAGTGTPGGAGTAFFGFDATQTDTLYGMQFASKPAGAESTGTIAFMANIADTTEAGIYTTTLTFIATGTY